MIQICSAIRPFPSIQDAIACALLWWRLADGDLWFESSTTESVCARPTDLRRPRGYGRRKKRDPNLHRTWSNRAGSCKAEEMLTPRVHFCVRGVGDGFQIEKVVMSFDISNQIRLKEGIEGEGGPKTGADRVTLWITLMGDVFAVAGQSYPTINSSMPP